MRKRTGSNPKRQLVALDRVDEAALMRLAVEAVYVGSGHHKKSPATYGFERTNIRPTKSLCDLSRVVTLDEAKLLLREGIKKCLISAIRENGFPKYIWCITAEGEVYEAQSDSKTPQRYHGYPLEPEDDMCRNILKNAR